MPVDANGWVYMWVATRESGRSVEILYIGKAGKTIKIRLGQQAMGFRGIAGGGSATGGKHADNIRKQIASGALLSVYARHSDTKEVLGELVSMCSVEESALIQKYNPPWNKIR